MFPDILPALIGHVASQVGHPAHSRIPNPRPERFLTLRRIGGTPTTVVDRPRIDVFAWAPTDSESMSLMLSTRSAIWSLAGKQLDGITVYTVGEFMGPRNIDDDQTGNPRAWATFELAIRADGAINPAP